LLADIQASLFQGVDNGFVRVTHLLPKGLGANKLYRAEAGDHLSLRIRHIANSPSVNDASQYWAYGIFNFRQQLFQADDLSINFHFVEPCSRGNSRDIGRKHIVGELVEAPYLLGTPSRTGIVHMKAQQELRNVVLKFGLAVVSHRTLPPRRFALGFTPRLLPVQDWFHVHP
jgi:hypothetical protein